MSAPVVAPDVLALELANARAQFAVLHIDWNEVDKRRHVTPDDVLVDITARLKACGQRVERLERQANGPPCPDYGAESGVVV